ncbi:hypothetical protein BdWA1_003120 [Babesia duncani]|uniref:Uncharacterized protein n=1 Tax=Babesia duncani TaxID=323732 RepID=A0AAD9UN14_9APIC|nr:hypothetical protein BdWA1_003120 [Babesia duncani]
MALPPTVVNKRVRLADMSLNTLIPLLLISNVCLSLAGFVGYAVLRRMFKFTSCKAFTYAVLDVLRGRGSGGFFSRMFRGRPLTVSSAIGILFFFTFLLIFGIAVNGYVFTIWKLKSGFY